MSFDYGMVTAVFESQFRRRTLENEKKSVYSIQISDCSNPDKTFYFIFYT